MRPIIVRGAHLYEVNDEQLKILREVAGRILAAEKQR